MTSFGARHRPAVSSHGAASDEAARLPARYQCGPAHLFEETEDDGTTIEFANPYQETLPTPMLRRELHRQTGIVFLEEDYDAQPFND